MSSNLRTSTRRAANSRRSERQGRSVAIANDSGNETDQFDEVEWEVDQVVGKRFGPEGEACYLVKWKNWEGDATWEPAENCQGCSRLVNEYELKINGPTQGSPARESSGRGSKANQSSSSNRSKVTPRRK